MANLNKTPQFWLDLKTSEAIFEKNKHLIDYDEPIPPFDTRFPGRLEGILESVRQTFDKENLNPTIGDATAAYFYQLISGHPFQNGNKRLATLFTHLFLIMNGFDLAVSYEYLYNFAILVAQNPYKLPPKVTKDACKKVFEDSTKAIDTKKIFGISL